MIPPHLSPLALVLTSSLITYIFALTFAPPVMAYVAINEFDIFASPQVVELVNQGSDAVDISGWYLDDSAGTTYVTIPSNSVLHANSCIVVRGTLNLNTASADTVRFFDPTAPPTHASAHLIDSYSYTQSPPTGNSYARVPDTVGSFAPSTPSLGLWNVSRVDCVILTPSLTPTGTPLPVSNTPTPSHTPTITPAFPPSHTPTPLPSPTVYPSPAPTSLPAPRIYLWEIMPDPLDGNEWVELYNDANDPYDLTGWKIDDIENGGSSPISLTGTIQPKGYRVIEMQSSVLNNSADSVRLIDSFGTEWEIVMYTNSQENITWGRTDSANDIFCLQSPSKGSANNPCMSLPTTPSPTPSPLMTTPVPDVEHIYLHELYVNPRSGQDEWIELYNDNRYTVHLTDWSVRDATGQTIAHITLDLDAYRSGIVVLTSSRMNNTDEVIELVSASGSVVDRFTYDESRQGISWGRSASSFTSWCLQEPSQGTYNYPCIVDPTNTPTPTPTPTHTPNPTKTKTPTPTVRVSVSSSHGSGSQGTILGATSSRPDGTTADMVLNYSPSVFEDASGSVEEVQEEPVQTDAVRPYPYNIESILSLTIFLLCMIGAGSELSKLWSISHTSSLASPDVFG